MDRLARTRFAQDLVQHLGPSLARQPSIVRIRRLSLRVVLRASDFSEDALSTAWTQAFGKALFTALAYPAGAGPIEVFRADSVAAFVASAICDLLNGTAAQWQYSEFEEFFRRGSTQASVGLISEWPQQTLPILLELAQRNVLARLLARFDEPALEQIFAILARPYNAETALASVNDLIVAAKLAITWPPEKPTALRTRAYALTLFVEGHRAGQPFQSPRVLFHSLLAIAVLLNPLVFWPDVHAGAMPSSQFGETGWRTESAELEGSGLLSRLAAPRWTEMLRAEPLAERLPSQVTAFLERLSNKVQREWQSSFLSGIHGLPPPQRGQRQSPGWTLHLSGGQLVELDQLLASLAAQLKVPPPLPPSSKVRWISTEWCGLFFLVGTLARLGWITAWKQLTAFQPGGVACLLAGLALAIAEKFDPTVPVLDPGIALFAGYIGDPDVAHLRQVFQNLPSEVRISVLEAALAHDGMGDAAESWAATFDRLAGILLNDFGKRIRGFRQATRPTIVHSFIAHPGRIRLEAQRIVVLPSPNAFHVALHISGLDEPIQAGYWMGELAIDFELGDL